MTNASRAQLLAPGLLFGALLLAVSTARGADIHVTDFVDDASTANGTCTLREAVRSANENTSIDDCEAGQNTVTDQILVAAGTHIVDLAAGNEEDSALTGDLDLLQAVDIRGAATGLSIIDGSGVGVIDRLFDVHAGVVVVIEQVTLRGGNAADSSGRGGVVRLVATGNLTLTEVDVVGGHADTGGGIHSEGTLTILDSRIRDNTAQDAGSTGNHGGGIAHEANGAALVIADSEISGNEAEEHGGGLWVAGGPLSLRRSLVSDNVAGGSGGGLHVSSADYLVTHSELAGNEANAGAGLYLENMGEVQRSALIDNTALATGGGVHDAFGGFVRYSTLSGNSAPTGGGVYANSTMTLLDSDTIARNSGGGVHNQSGAFFENTIVAENTGGNCTGSAPNFGAFNLENTNTCGFVSTVTTPNYPNTNAKLGTLGNHGGPTRSIPLLAGGRAIDAVTSEIRTNCQLMPDQRGYPRGRPRTRNELLEDVFLCDIGAFELVAPFVVDSLDDAVDADLADDVCETAGGACTLRAAIQQANALPGNYEIVLGPGSHVLSLAGTGEDLAATGDLDIDPPLLIRGAGAGLTTVSGAGLDRVFDVGALMHVNTGVDKTVLRDLGITGGDAGSQNGGGILLRNFPLELLGVRLFGNEAPRGSAISSTTGTFFGAGDRPVRLVDSSVEGNTGGMALYLHEARIERSSLVDNVNSQGSNGGAGEFVRVELLNSTVSGNFAGATGAFFAGRAVVDSSTIHDNSADFEPGGVFLLERSAFRNSIVSRNLVGANPVNCSSNSLAISSLGHNLTDTGIADCELADATDTLSTDPVLGALADNGGPTRTHLPLAGSPAIDDGDPVACPAFDQRGFLRPADGDLSGSALCDIGAVEVPEPGLCAGLAAGAGWLAARVRRRGQGIARTRGANVQ